jgi:hypothetical protein
MSEIKIARAVIFPGAFEAAATTASSTFSSYSFMNSIGEHMDDCIPEFVVFDMC